MTGDIIVISFGIAALIGAIWKKGGYLGTLVSAAIFLVLEYRQQDYLSYFSLIASVVWMIVSIYSLEYGEKYGKWLSSLIPAMIMGMALILVSNNYLEIIAGWETMSIPAYLIVALNKKTDGPAFTFMMFSEFSTILIISGAAYAYAITGSFDFISTNSYVPLLLISVGALIKMGMTPFMISEWLPIAHGNAPANASAVLSATMTLMGVFFIMKLTLLNPDFPGLGYLFLAIGSISILFASIYAYISENMKMLAGFSTIENNAAILSAIGLYIIASSPTLRGFILVTIIIFSLSHAVSKTGLFMSIGNSQGEYFGEQEAPTTYSQRIGTIITTMSLSGLFPTIGGLATWMLLESFFMEAYFGGPAGMTAIVTGSIVALAEGMATGSMIKILSFGNIFRHEPGKKREPGQEVLSGTGLLLIILFAVSLLFIPSEFKSGIPAVLVANGFMIVSSFGQGVFGLISPDYVLVLLLLFSLMAYFAFGRPKARTVPVWNGGAVPVDPYTSYAYSNNIRLMLHRVLRTKTGIYGHSSTAIDIFWLIMNDIGKGYRGLCRFVTLKVMNSSIGWYMAYMIVAFMVILLVSVTVY